MTLDAFWASLPEAWRLALSWCLTHRVGGSTRIAEALGVSRQRVQRILNLIEDRAGRHGVELPTRTQRGGSDSTGGIRRLRTGAHARLCQGQPERIVESEPTRRKGRAIDMVGHTFGRLTVLSLSPERSRSKARVYACACVCGRSVEVIGNTLRRGLTKSCGCLNVDPDVVWRRSSKRRKDLIGQRFGLLTVIGLSPRKRTDGSGVHSLWECRCDCGGTKDVMGFSLRAGDVKSCGTACALASRYRQEPTRATLAGEDLTLDDMAKIADVKKETIRRRLLKGERPEEAIGPPRRRRSAST